MRKIVLVSATLLGLALFFFLGVRWVQNSPSSFSQEKLKTSFISYVSSIRGVKKLQLAEIQSLEIIERESKFSIFWNMIEMPDVVVQAKIPVFYSYYVDLAEPMTFVQRQGELWVEAPALKANPPAADVSAITYEVKKGSLFRNPKPVIEEVRQTITPLLNEIAEQKKALVIDSARQQLSDIIQLWLSQNPEFQEQIQGIRIEFAAADRLPDQSFDSRTGH